METKQKDSDLEEIKVTQIQTSSESGQSNLLSNTVQNHNNGSESERNEIINEKYSVEDLLVKLGGFGKFQWRQTFLTGSISIVDAFAVLSMLFTCHLEPDGFPAKGTVLEEYGIYGDLLWMNALANSLLFGGWIFGNYFAGLLSDKKGRKVSLFVFICVFLTGGLLQVVSPSFEFYVATRAVYGAGIGGQGLVGWVLAAEFWPLKSRATVGCMFQGFFAVGIMLLVPVAYFVTYWRYLIIFCTLPVLLILLSWKYICESPRWLLVNGKKERAFKIFEEIGQLNGVSMDEINLENLHFTTRSNKNVGSALDLFKTPKMRKYTLSLMYMWSVVASVYYGIAMYGGQLSGQVHLNSLLIAFVELPSYVLAVYLMKFGRRKADCIFFCTTALFCLAVFADPVDWLRTVLAMGGKFCISAAFSCVYVYSTEVFPTTHRNIGIGVASLAARIGAMISPFLLLLDYPLILFGFAAALASVVVLFLPETLNQPLPETIEEVREDSVAIFSLLRVFWIRFGKRYKSFEKDEEIEMKE